MDEWLKSVPHMRETAVRVTLFRGLADRNPSERFDQKSSCIKNIGEVDKWLKSVPHMRQTAVRVTLFRRLADRNPSERFDQKVLV